MRAKLQRPVSIGSEVLSEGERERGGRMLGLGLLTTWEPTCRPAMVYIATIMDVVWGERRFGECR